MLHLIEKMTRSNEIKHEKQVELEQAFLNPSKISKRKEQIFQEIR